jgi:hypothetical protein
MKGFKKDGKFIPTGNRNKSSLKKSDIDNAKTEADMSALILKQVKSSPEYKRGDVRVINDLGLERNKKTLEKGKDFHLYRVWQYDSNDRQEIAVVKAKDMEQAMDYVKKEYLTKEGQENVSEEGDGEFGVLTLMDEPDDTELKQEIHDEASSMTFKNIAEQTDWEGDELADRIEMEESNVYGYQIDEDDESEESFHTIYGSNDFVDLLDTSNSGKKYSDVVKEKGGQDNAFFSASGLGFEAGNPDNNFNLNLKQGEKLNLYDPKTNPKPTGRSKETIEVGGEHPQLKEGVNKEQWYFDIKENTWRKVK